MKIERISENQIRCTLTRGELLARHLNASKLTGGEPEAKQLLRELLERSHEELDFDLDGKPLMVETSLSEAGLIMTVTKLDGQQGDPKGAAPGGNSFANALMNILDLAVRGGEKGKTAPRTAPGAAQGEPDPKKARGGADAEAGTGAAAFSFFHKENLMALKVLPELDRGIRSSLYYQPKNKLYYLLITAPKSKAEVLERAACLLSEYGHRLPATDATRAYYKEHYVTVFARGALEQLKTAEEGSF